MRLFKETEILRLLLTLLVVFVHKTNGYVAGNKSFEVSEEITIEEFPAMQHFLKVFPPPLGAVFGGDVLSIKSIYSFFGGKSSNLKSNYILTTIGKQFKRLEDKLSEESKKIVDDLKFVVEINNSTESMQLHLDNISEVYFEDYTCIRESTCTSMRRNDLIHDMTDYSSSYRKRLRNLIPWFIDSSTTERKSISKNEFFTFFMQKSQLSRDNDDDCYPESIHTKIYKAWVHITNVLTKGYSIVVAAHAVHIEDLTTKQSNAEGITEAIMMSRKLKQVIEEYFAFMKILMTKAELPLKESSREIRNCGSFHLEKGETFERLNFIQTRFKFFKSLANSSADCTEYFFLEPEFYNTGFILFNCKVMENGYFKIYVNPDDEERYFHHIDQIHRGKVIGTIGKKEEIPLHRFYILGESSCNNFKCDAFKSKRMKYSTNYVTAQQGFVVTGIRWRVRSNIIYIEIQQGKLIDGTQVESDTVAWKETPEIYRNVKSLDINLRSISLSNIILPNKYYVTGVQLYDDLGIIKMSVKAQRINDDGIGLLGITIESRNVYLGNMTELKLNRPNDPELAPIGTKNLVMRDQNEYFVKFQSSDFQRDLGRTTVPYFDIRDVVTKPSAPISGLGIYYEAVPGYGGLVGLKMFSSDFNYIMNKTKLDDFFTNFSMGDIMAI